MHETVLVVDDTMLMRSALSQILAEAGNYNVVVAEDGVSALVMAKEVMPDLVLMDIEMPNLNGFEAARGLRMMLEDHTPPILFVTGSDKITDKEKGFESGGIDYLVKPIEPRELLMRVRRILKESKDSRDAQMQIRQETLENLMVTIAHHTNNALAGLIGRFEITDWNDPEKVAAFRQHFERQTRKISAIVSSLREMGDSGELQVVNYLDMKTKMFDITDRIEQRMNELE